ncbi:PIN-like domain-containing protein [Sphingobacterium suaedae]|uniref:PIN-like domain-containing protein n=1 Tax=Sphingobacterium suaedae TaxID=1686402 RepID=A0ABW5KFB3_9SPHI
MFDEKNFYLKKEKYDVLTYNTCAKKYVSGFQNAIELKGKYPIFLDTNVLLRYYSISFTARKKLFDFLMNVSKRIFITGQVQKEFLRNREEVISQYFKQVSEKIPSDFNTDIVNKMQNFIDQHKTVLKDYPYMEEGLNTHKKHLEDLLSKLNEETEERRKKYNSLVWNDDFLNLIETFSLLPELEPDKVKSLHSSFDQLRKKTESANLETLLNKPGEVFPGLCDIKKKPDDPYGDYIIYHEIMAYLKDHNTDAVFLTFDTTKGDWMSRSKTPHMHYVYNMYLNTNQILYIVDADRTLEQLINVDLESLIEIKPIKNPQLLKDQIVIIMRTHEIFNGLSVVDLNDRDLESLSKAGIKDPRYIINVLNLCLSSVEEIKQQFLSATSSTRGMLLICLRCVNNILLNEYIDSISSALKPIRTRRYKKLRNLIIH